MVAVQSGFTGPAGLTLPKGSLPVRTPWRDFADVMTKAFATAPDDVPPIEEAAYVREILQLAVIDDLLGPAGGPHERILDMGVRDRYLVGKLAPREEERGGIEGLAGPLAAEDEEEPDDLETDRRRHDPGEEFESTSGRVDPEADAADEIEASSNQSLVPSSFGFTFCIDGQVDKIEVETRWGRYERVYKHGETKKVNPTLNDPQ